MNEKFSMTPELFNLLTLPNVLPDSLSIIVEDVDGYSHNIIEMINNASDSLNPQ